VDRVTQTHASDVKDLLIERGAWDPGRSTSSVAQDWSMEEHRVSPGSPSSADLHDELNRASRKAGTLPKPSAVLGGVLNDVALGVGSFTLGWEIGTGIRKRYLSGLIEPPPQGTPTDWRLRYKNKGDVVGFGQNTPAGGNVIMPRDGWVITYSLDAQRLANFAHYIAADPARCPQAPAPGTWLPGVPKATWDFVFNGNQGSCGGPAITDQGYHVLPLDKKGDGKGAFGPATETQPEGVDTWITSPAPTTTETAADDAVDYIHDHPDEFPTTITWLDSQLDDGTSDDPTIVYVDVPAPEAGETAEAYRERLEDVGIKGRVVPLTGDDVDPQKEPGSITRVEPEPGTRVPTGTTIDIRTQPGEKGEDPVGHPGPDSIPPIDFDPLKSAASAGCASFPLGIPCWMHDLLGEWVGTPVTPSWTFEFPFVAGTGDFTVDLAMFDTIAPDLRAILLVLAIASMAWVFMGLAFGGGPDTSKQGDGKGDG
jgi:hypothetical protein